jgi:hypothetical protein
MSDNDLEDLEDFPPISWNDALIHLLNADRVPPHPGDTAAVVHGMLTHTPSGYERAVAEEWTHRNGLGHPPNLQCQPRPEPGIGLPQLHPRLLRQRHQLIPRPLVKTAIRWIGDGLFHHASAGKWGPTPIF